MHPLATYLVHRLFDPKDKWFPFIAVFYLTYQCSFRCPFCSDGSGKPYHHLPKAHLPAREAIRLLKIIRRKCDYLVMTGGEPLQHPDFAEIMAAVGSMRFREVILTTNGYAVDKHLAVIATTVTSLGFSLNTLDPWRSDRFFGLPGKPAGKTLNTILANIERADRLSRKRFQIHISSVVTPDNMRDLYHVYEYARRRNFVFAACPQLVGVKPHADLVGNDEFKAFYQFLLDQKQKGNQVYGTIPYLEHMRDLRRFRCFPFTMLVVSPTGEVSYPCLEIGHQAGNLLENQDLHAIRRNGQKRFGPQPDCDNRCQSACALGFALFFQYPLAPLQEAWFQAKGLVKRFFNLA